MKIDGLRHEPDMNPVYEAVKPNFSVTEEKLAFSLVFLKLKPLRHNLKTYSSNMIS